MRIILIAITLLFLICFKPALGLGSFILSFSPDQTLTSLTVNQGDTFTVDVYLIETLTSDLTTHGLLSFGFRGDFDDSIITAVSRTSTFPNFTKQDNDAPGFIEVYGFASGGAPPKANPILLATIQFQASGVGTTTFAIGDLDADFDDFAINFPLLNPTSIDPILFGNDFTATYSLTILSVTAVPEPSSILFGMLVLLGGAVRHRVQKDRGR